MRPCSGRGRRRARHRPCLQGLDVAGLGRRPPALRVRSEPPLRRRPAPRHRRRRSGRRVGARAASARSPSPVPSPDRASSSRSRPRTVMRSRSRTSDRSGSRRATASPRVPWSGRSVRAETPSSSPYVHLSSGTSPTTSAEGAAPPEIPAVLFGAYGMYKTRSTGCTRRCRFGFPTSESVCPKAASAGWPASSTDSTIATGISSDISQRGGTCPNRRAR